MGGRWNLLGFQLHKVLWIVLMLHLQSDECLSLNLEGLALLEFRAKVNVDPHDAFKNWNPEDREPCNWSGVRCIDGKVEALNLQEMSLGGVLASELGELSHLRSLVLYKNNFSGVIPKEIGRLTMLELLDLRSNNLSGTIPTEIGEMSSLRHLMLCNNKIQGAGPLAEELKVLSELECEQNLSSNVPTDISCVNRKVGQWFKCKRGSSSHGHVKKHSINIETSMEPYFEQNFVNSVRRKLLQETSNLPAAPVSGSPFQEAVSVPSIGSGSFPAVPNSNGNAKKQSPEVLRPKDVIPTSLAIPEVNPAALKPTNSANSEPSLSERLGKWAYALIFPGAAFLIMVSASMLLMCRRQGAATIGPWKTGLSGQLQKAFLAGVPKLNRAELEAACEDFSNIISTYPECTVFKGTLSSGVEIAVVSTVVTAKGWSKRSEVRFRKKIDALSRINHKNFVNLLGFCEENEPFMRMMVFEYATNGTLFEHLHLKEFEHLDWSARMRIIMGMAYFLQYLHHELNPPIAITDLESSSIFMTDDYAAKICDNSIWKEVAAQRSKSIDDDMDPSESPFVDPGCNIYSFGILLLEIVSGKIPYSKEEGSILNWAAEYLNDKHNIRQLVDPTLKSFKSNELDIICEIIEECIRRDPHDRPTMKEITGRLREELSISPDAATPRLSPLWWAELEILSVEAS